MAKVSLRAYNREIETMIDRGQLDEAIAHCHHILKTFPKHLETYRLLGKAYLEYKRYKDAVDIFSRVLVVEPNDFVANVGMSIVRDEENKLDDAIWHMERAFEVQSANPAIQGEMQRLYGRREGVQPPRIRMTRGALAHMYVQGELYPQAISEVKSVLKDDPGRTDMQVLMARAYFKSGQKTEAADTASSVLRRYPYCLDANRILVEILGVDRPENSQLYRQRVIELDPYAAQVSGSIFESKEVGDAAVTIEHLDWNGQPVGLQSDWESTRAVRLESENKPGPQTQPDWLKSGGFTDLTPPQPSPNVVPPLPASTPSFDIPTEPPIASQPAQPTLEDDIPDFLREAGWGQSTGAFDESKSSFADEPIASASTSAALPIEQGDMPDWVKAMAPPQTAPADQPAEEEELPDWINKIGTGALPASAVSTSSDDQSDWMNQLDQPAQSSVPVSDDQPDWMKGFDQPVASQPAADDQPDWMKGFGNEAEATSAPSSIEQPDWMKGFGDEPESTPASSSSVEQPDWMTQFGSQPEEPVLPTSSLPAENEFDFLNELAAEPTPQPVPSTMDTGNLGTSQSEIDDSLAWLENLAAKQGATEGLLIKPEDRMEKEPDWVSQVKKSTGELHFQPSTQQPEIQPAANVEELGKSQSEIDDSLAWLENLAAKQGATEGLLIKPEDRMEKEPDWVSQAKSAPQVPSQPAANVEELGKSQSEIDDSLAWLENLAAKQGATEGLLIKPEDRMEKEPDWVSQVKSTPQPSAPSEQPSISADDTAAWLRSLDEEESIPEPASANDETAMWLKTLDEPEPAAQTDDMPEWMQGIGEEQAPVAESAAPANEPVDESDWMNAIEEPVAPSELEAVDEDIPSWLKGMDEESKMSTSLPQDDLPAWMRDETGEVMAEPTRIEPTRSTDWQPVEEKRPEPPAPKPIVQEQPKPEPVAQVEEKPKPAPVVKKAAPKPTEVKPAIPPAPYREPVTQRGTGMLTMPIDPILGSARNELSRSNIPGALEAYAKLIKKGRFLDEVIFDLRDALYRYPVEISIWQSLGDAYMRANRLQDALDAYTKAEELLR